MHGRITNEAEIIGCLAGLTAQAPGALGLRDDAATLVPRPGFDLVLTTDAIAAGVHFFTDDAPADIAWKALAVNVSDLAGKAARPLAYLMALSFPEAPERYWLHSFADGLGVAQRAFGITLIGGDTDRRPGPVTITITAIGEVQTGRAVRRTTAQPGDRLFVSGTLGDAALGLLLKSGHSKTGSWELAPDEAAYLIARYLRPTPRLGLAAALEAHASAAMDLSDGLAKDLAHLCRASGVSATVDTRRLPLHEAVRRTLARDERAIDLIVGGGDDYEILASVPAVEAGAFAASAADHGVMVTEIGALASAASQGPTVILSGSDGRRLELTSQGWDHF